MRKHTGDLCWGLVGSVGESWYDRTKELAARKYYKKPISGHQSIRFRKPDPILSEANLQMNLAIAIRFWANAYAEQHKPKQNIDFIDCKLCNDSIDNANVSVQETFDKYSDILQLLERSKVGSRVLKNNILTTLKESAWRYENPTSVEYPYETPKAEYYKGIVKELEGSSVIATVSSPEDWDRWDARIPLASFDQVPKVGQEFSCTVTIRGSDINIRAEILHNKGPRTLKDFGIDKKELLEWASKIDV